MVKSATVVLSVAVGVAAFVVATIWAGNSEKPYKNISTQSTFGIVPIRAQYRLV